MKTISKIYLTFFCFAILACTKDFITKDISKNSITILAPANNLSTPNNAITFWWEHMEGADKYTLQIVKPDFSSVQQLILDTNIIGDKFNFTLTPGTYQWRIKGVNNAGSTQYVTYNLIIDTTSNLSSQLIIPIAPVDNYLTGTKTIAFSWNSLSSADNYQLQILNSSSTIIKDTTTTNNYLTTSLTTGGVYTWKIRAFNAFSISQYNSLLTFTIDVTPPVASVINYPSNSSFVKDTTYLKWTRSSSDTWYDSLYVSIDSAFSSVISASKVYATKLKISSLSSTIPVSSNYYWWRVRSVDSVGNKSGYSNQLKFKLIP